MALTKKSIKVQKSDRLAPAFNYGTVEIYEAVFTSQELADEYNGGEIILFSAPVVLTTEDLVKKNLKAQVEAYIETVNTAKEEEATA